MSVSDDAKEIISLASKFENERDPNKKSSLLDEIEKANSRIQSKLSDDFYKQEIPAPPPKASKQQKSSKTPPKESLSKLGKDISINTPKKTVKTTKKKPTISKSQRKKLIQELEIDEDDIRRVYRTKKKSKKQTPYEYTIYSTNAYAQLSNRVFGSFVENLRKNNKNFYNPIADSVRISGMQFLSRTYISMMFFTSMIAAILVGFFTILLTSSLKLGPIAILLSTIFSIILAAVLTFLAMYAYPASEAARKAREISNDLPFAIIHMAAIAGSGAKPISMFKLILKSGEYKGLESEIKKIVNYVNLFGYDLSTALKSVSLRTPSKRLKDLLNGIAATIESGGSLKSYLKNVADDAMNTYRLKRKKYVEALSTYSDIYTGVLIAAPLLFIVTLAIINLMGGTVAGISVGTIAIIGTFVILPLINIMFYLFLNISQPGE